MTTTIVRGEFIVTEPGVSGGGVIADGAVVVADNLIADIGPYRELRERHVGATVIGSGREVVIPGLIDAHSHGQGLSPFQKGAGYDFLENAQMFRWSLMPRLPADLAAALAAVNHLRSGATTIHHTGWDDDGPDARNRAVAAIRAYADAGMRCAYSPAIRDRNKLCAGEEDFVRTLPPDLAAWAEAQIGYSKDAVAERYLELFESLYAEFNSPMCRVFFGPSWAHGTTDSLFERIRDRAHELGDIPIHIHTLQTPHQRAYGLKAFGKSLISYLDERGLLTEGTTLGHAVWLSQADIELMAERGAGTSHHPGCNLHVRNGISPIYPMIKAGVRVAIGIDDKSFNDDEDILVELRLAYALSRVPGFALAATPALEPHEILAMGTGNAARAIGFGGEIGAIRKGMKADLVLLDGDALLRDPWQSPQTSIPEVVLMRATRAHVTTVMVDGGVVLDQGRILTVDVDALYREIRSCLAKAPPPDRERMAMLDRIRPYYHAWYGAILEHLDVEAPHYPMNGK